jgi:uncharacterized protein (TIGR02996 family)
MTPAEVFLRDIVEHPDDDTPRLIFADWLEEHGDPARGEFIRVQVQLAAGSVSLRLKQREQELLRENAVRWLGGWISKLQRWLFRRGFLEQVRCRASHFLQHDGLIDREPLAQVSLQRTAGVLDNLAASPLLGRLTGLDLSYNFLGDAGVAVLASSAHLGRLRVLRLAHNSLRSRSAEILARTLFLSQLQLLDLSGNNISGPGREQLLSRYGPAVRF